MDDIFNELKGLHLTGMADSWNTMAETRTADKTSLREGLLLLIQAERERRANNRTAKLIKNARFRYAASIEQLNCDQARGVDKETVTRLASCEWIRTGGTVLVT